MLIGSLVILLILTLCFAAGVSWWLRRRVIRLRDEFIDYVLHHVSKTVKQLPRIQQIMEYDKVLDHILSELGYRGTLSQKMQQYQKKFTIDQSTWDAHRERNKLAHEIGYAPIHRAVDYHVKALEREVERILERHS